MDIRCDRSITFPCYKASTTTFLKEPEFILPSSSIENSFT